MSLLARLLCAAAAALLAATAAATPVSVGSTHNLFLASAAWDRSVVTGRGGIDRVRFSMLVQEIPAPGALVLLALPLALVPCAGRRADPRWMRATISRA